MLYRGTFCLMGDLIFELAEWMRGTALVDWAIAMTEWPINLWIVTNFWAIPIFQVIHILAMAAAFGASLMMTLRVFGAAGHGVTIADTQARFLPWMWYGLLLLLLSGLLMIVGEPIRELINPIFWGKMILVIVLVLSTIAYHKSIARKAAPVGASWTGSAATRLTSFILLMVWCLVMAGGRWIAYAPV